MEISSHSYTPHQQDIPVWLCFQSFYYKFSEKDEKEQGNWTGWATPRNAEGLQRVYCYTPLHHIINFSLQSKIVPSAWKKAKLVPIFKSGDQGKAENYRPISVLPVLSKLLEKAVHSQLIDYLERNKLLSESQFGYRERRSTQLATTLLVDEIRQSADCGKMVRALFLDLSKAFDTMSHDFMLSKLREFGVASLEREWFADYLFGRFQLVQIGYQ